MADPRIPSPNEWRMVLADPVGTIERECAEPEMKQRDVAFTYALAMRDEALVPVDWRRANAAIARRWPKGLVRVKELAWKMMQTGQSEVRRGQ